MNGLSNFKNDLHEVYVFAGDIETKHTITLQSVRLKS